MASENDSKFYVGIAMENGQFVGHTIGIGKHVLYENNRDNAPHLDDVVSKDFGINFGELTFSNVFSSFSAVMDSYRNFIATMLTIVPYLSTAMLESQLQSFAKTHGLKRADLSTDTTTIYEIGVECYRDYRIAEGKMRSAAIGAKQLPDVMLIGLVSAYDAFLARLLRVVIYKQPNIALTADKLVTYEDLNRFQSMQELREGLITKEVENVIRMGHDEQFKWMKNKFKVELLADLPVWPTFVELCERRNLMTHTGGHVSTDYLAACKNVGIDVSTILVGSRLKVTAEYYKTALDAIYEIGIKLAVVLWRKFEKEEPQEAEKRLNELAYELIVDRAYGLAETLLIFGTQMRPKIATEKTRRMMTVNLANAIRLQNRPEEAKTILGQEDWSAASSDFQLCVAAIEGRVKDVISAMDRIGNATYPSMQDYRTWPIFRGLHTNEEFTKAFERIFGQPYNRPTVIVAGPDAEQGREGTLH